MNEQELEAYLEGRLQYYIYRLRINPKYLFYKKNDIIEVYPIVRIMVCFFDKQNKEIQHPLPILSAKGSISEDKISEVVSNHIDLLKSSRERILITFLRGDIKCNLFIDEIANSSHYSLSNTKLDEW